MRGAAGVAAPLADPHPVFDAAQGRRDIVILGCSTAPAGFNAANEECVDAFLAGPSPFNAIVDTVAEGVAENGRPTPGTQLTFPDVLQAETWARTRARELAAATQKAAAVIS